MIDRFYIRKSACGARQLRILVMKLGNGQYVSGLRSVHRTDGMVQDLPEERVMICYATFDIKNADQLTVDEWAKLLDEEHPQGLEYPDGARLVEVTTTTTEME